MLVSAIMPTRGRPQFAARAVECFLSQDWPEKELVIVDDGDCRSFEDDTLPDGEYRLMARRLTVGAKRNIACSRANGDVIMHWDDDDWSAPGRMRDQVERLLSTNCGLTGYHSMLFEDAQTGRRWQFRASSPHYALGTSFCYTREFWQAHPFPDVNVSEDNAIVHRVSGIVSVDAGELMIATIHNGNTSDKRKNLHKESWEEVCA